MNKDRPATTSMFDPLQGVTGRDGLFDHVARARLADSYDPREPAERFARALGKAVIATWGQLAREDQERIFEHAVVLGHEDVRDEALREQLAKFLHDHHERTVTTGPE